MGWPAYATLAERAKQRVFGEQTLYEPAEGPAVSVVGIFDAPHVHVDVGPAGVSSNGPAVSYLLVDLPSDPDEDEPVITVRGVRYDVADTQKDDVGAVRLRLHVARDQT